MLSNNAKIICDVKLQFLCSSAVLGMVTGWCNGLSGEQKDYILTTLYQKLCLSLNIPISLKEIKDESTN